VGLIKRYLIFALDEQHIYYYKKHRCEAGERVRGDDGRIGRETTEGLH
jgi:hypothetical protein